MSELEKIQKCLTCGGSLRKIGSGILKCEYCGNTYKEKYLDDLPLEFIIQIVEIANARQLRDFQKAEELCTELIKKEPNNSEVHWQKLLSKLGIVYVKKGEEKGKPTFFLYEYNEENWIENNEDYQKAVEYATPDQREFYEEQGRQLDKILKNIFAQEEKEPDFDIFISFLSHTTAEVDGEKKEIDTDDSIKAREIYEYFHKLNYNVFFSPESIGKDKEMEGEYYEARIYKALKTSQAMILLGSKSAYLESDWVQNEWRRYRYFIQKERKEKNSLVIVYDKQMPTLPLELREIQYPTFKWFKADYLEDLKKQLSFVHPANKHSIKRKNVQKFETDEINFASATRITIHDNPNNLIQISASEARDLQDALNSLESKHFSSAKVSYSEILRKYPNNYEAYWGLFKATIKAKNDNAVPKIIYSKKNFDQYFDCIDKAIENSTNESFSWKIIDLLIQSLDIDVDWSKKEKVYNELIKYLDEERTIKVMETVYGFASGFINNKLKVAESIFESLRKLFSNENKELAIKYIYNFAYSLYTKNYYKEAKKYFEEIALKDSQIYLYLLGCRLKTQNITQTKITLKINPDDDASKKKPSELDLDEIFERAIICNYDETKIIHDTEEEISFRLLSKSIKKQIEDIVDYQIQHNKKNVQPFIEIVVSCYVKFKQDKETIDFLMFVAQRFLRLKDFEEARVYYNEVLNYNPNYSKAYWGLLMCRCKVDGEINLSKKFLKKYDKLKQTQEFENAKNCSTDEEFKHYTRVINGDILSDSSSQTIKHSEDYIKKSDSIRNKTFTEKEEKKEKFYETIIINHPTSIEKNVSNDKQSSSESTNSKESKTFSESKTIEKTASNSEILSIYLLAQREFANGNYDEALDLCEKVLWRTPENAEAWWLKFLAENKVSHENYLTMNLTAKSYRDIKSNNSYHQAYNYAKKNGNTEIIKRILIFNKSIGDAVYWWNKFLSKYNKYSKDNISTKDFYFIMRDEDLNIAKENANKKLFKTIEKFLKTENKRIKKAENRKIGHQNTQKQVKEVKECCCCACCDSCSSSYD